MAQAHLIERLSAQDLAALWWDSYGWPGDIGALIIVDGTGLVDRDGRFRIEAVRAGDRAENASAPPLPAAAVPPSPGAGLAAVGGRSVL